MIHKVTNRQIIKSSQNKAFKSIIECEKWPEFIPSVKLVEVLDVSGNTVVRRLHSQINNKIIKMVTKSNIFYDIFTIKYEQIEVPWPLKTNGGEWVIRKIDDEHIEMLLTHIFTVQYSLIGDLIAKLVITPFYIYRHNKKILKLYKKRLESTC